MTIDADTVAGFITTHLEGLDTILTPHARFYYYDPARDIPHDRRQPFATLTDSDEFDGGASDLDRPGVYRLNMGVTRDTYRALFGPEPPWGKDGGPVATGHDFRALDTLLPHPIYAPMSWICILSPSAASWPRVQELLREAHAHAARQHARRRAGTGDRPTA